MPQSSCVVPRLVSLIHSTLALTTAILLFATARLAAAEPPPELEAPKVDGAELRAKALASPTAKRHDELGKWYNANLQYDGKWMSLEEAQAAAADDDRLTEYQELRRKWGDTRFGHERLARWCARNELTELAEVHWLHVLRFTPQDRAALSSLDMQWVGGMLMTDNEAQTFRQQADAKRQRAEQWQGKAKLLRRTLEKGERDERDEARLELAKIDDPAAVAALVDQLAPPARDPATTDRIRTVLMETLGKFDAPMAIDVLLDFAVSSPPSSVRYAAVQALKSRPLEEYVPQLLTELRLPVEGSVATREQGGRIVSSYSFEQEGPSGQAYQTGYSTAEPIYGPRFSSVDVYQRRQTREAYTRPERTRRGFWGLCGGWVPPRVLPAEEVPAEYGIFYAGKAIGDELPGYSQQKAAAQSRSMQNAARVGDQVAQQNVAINHRNQRIAGLLTEVTGETLDAFPKSWWNWWRDEVKRNPALARGDALGRIDQAILSQQPRALARGSRVWTIAGLQPVEDIQVGDFLLSQDPESGELAYKPVVATAALGWQATATVEIGDDKLTCSPGQVFWASGIGWRRAGDVAGGGFVHAVHNEAAVGQTREAFEIDVYNLVVKDFHTMFVGEQGVLTHDGAPIGRATTLLPGFKRGALSLPRQVAVK